MGIAWLQGTCDPGGFGRSSVNEYLGDDATTASVSQYLEEHDVKRLIKKIMFFL